MKWNEMKQDWILQAKQYISTDIRIILTSTEYQIKTYNYLLATKNAIRSPTF